MGGCGVITPTFGKWGWACGGTWGLFTTPTPPPYWEWGWGGGASSTTSGWGSRNVQDAAHG